MAIKRGKLEGIKAALTASGGFTLIEVVIALSLLSLATGMIGAGLFHVHGIQKFWRDGAVATRDLRHAGSWFAGDALNAESVLTSPPPGGVPLPCEPGAPFSSVTLTWDDSDSSHVTTYTVSGEELTRTYDGDTIRLSQIVIALNTGFSLCNSLCNDVPCDHVLTFDMAVTADRGNSESMSLETRIRKLD